MNVIIFYLSVKQYHIKKFKMTRLNLYILTGTIILISFLKQLKMNCTVEKKLIITCYLITKLLERDKLSPFLFGNVFTLHICKRKKFRGSSSDKYLQ